MNSRHFRLLIYKTVTLYAVWLVLSQSARPFHLATGLLASFAIARLNNEVRPAAARIRWVHALMYLPWILWKILQSGSHVAYLILHPRLPIDPKLIRYKPNLPTPLGVVTLGNSITLTPGTITAEANDKELVIHALDDQASEDLTSLIMEKKIAGLFRTAQ